MTLAVRFTLRGDSLPPPWESPAVRLARKGARDGDRPPIRDTVNNLFTGVPVTTAQNNPCCDYWRDDPARTPSPRVGSYFGGAHTAGMNTIMADGSVRVISWNVNQAIFFSLGHKSDGGVVTDNP